MPALLLACTLLLAACAAPAPPEGLPPGRSDGPPVAPRADRAAEAGLSADQARRLADLGVPIAVPTLPEGWTLTDFDAGVFEEGSFRYPHYTLHYRHTGGACFALDAASEGLGDVFITEPPHVREVDVPGLAAYGPALLGWAEEGEDGEARMQTEWFGADGLALGLVSRPDDGCRRLAPGDAASLLGGLRYLDPDDDVLALGPMQWMDLSDPPIGEMGNGPTPEATAAQAFAMTEGEGRFVTTTETLRRRDAHAVVLVTNTNVPDDSIRDERVRVVLVPGDEGWLVTEAGRQVRCREGRGHTDWGAAPCL